MTDLEERLKLRGSDDEEKNKARLEIAVKELEHAKLEGFHEKIFVNDDLQATYDALEKYIFSSDNEDEVSKDRLVVATLKGGDVEMEMTDEAPVPDAQIELDVTLEAPTAKQTDELTK